MKKLITLIFLICATIILSMTVKINGSYWNSSNYPEKEITLTRDVDFDLLTIDIGSGNVIIKESDNNKTIINIKYKEEKDQLTFDLIKGKLTSIAPKNYNFTITEVIALIPTNKDLYADTGSGDISILGFANELTRADTGSGNVIIKKSNSQKLDIDTGSGDVSVLDCFNQEMIKADTGSGNVTISNCQKTKTLNVDTGSGEINLLDSSVVLFWADTGSGDVNIKNSVIVKLTSNTGSGRVRAQDSEIQSRVGDSYGDEEGEF